jgi:hypothetical protein
LKNKKNPKNILKNKGKIEKLFLKAEVARQK